MDSIGTAILRAFGPPEWEGYGLQVAERVKRSTRGAVILHQGNLYPWLRLLERDGLLRSWDGETTAERSGRPRRYYALTASGWDVIRPLRQGPIDAKSPRPIGRAPVLVRGQVVGMIPPLRYGQRLRGSSVDLDLDDKLDAKIIRMFRRKAAHV